jgi:hypothetical protein
MWRELVHTVNRRLAGAINVNDRRCEFINMIQLNTEIDHDLIEIRHLLPKSTIFSSQIYEISYFICKFYNN